MPKTVFQIFEPDVQAASDEQLEKWEKELGNWRNDGTAAMAIRMMIAIEMRYRNRHKRPIGHPVNKHH